MDVAIDTKSEFGRLIRAASVEKPKRDDLAALDAYLAKNGYDELAKLGDLHQHIIAMFISRAFPKNRAMAMAVAANVAKQKEDLGYEQSSPLECQLIDHVCLCRLRLIDCEIRYDAVRGENSTMAQMEHWEKRLSAVQRRYLRSIESLARVRRLLTPGIQVNIGAQQQIIGST